MKNIIIVLMFLIGIALALSTDVRAVMPTLTSGGAWEKTEPSKSEAEVKKPVEEPKKKKKSIYDYDVEEKEEVEIDLAIVKFKMYSKEVVARICNLADGEPLENVKVSFYIWEESFKGSGWEKLSDQYIEKLESGMSNYVELSIPLPSGGRDKLFKVTVDPDKLISEDYTSNNSKEAGVRKAPAAGTVGYEY